MQLIYLGIAGAVLAGGAIWAAWRSTKAKRVPESVEMEIVFDERPASIARPPQAPAPVARAPPPSSPRAHPERAPAMVLTQGVQMRDSEFSRRSPAQAPAPRPPMREPPPMKSWAQQVRETTQAAVPTEWARRQVGPVEPGRVAGACGGCGARLSVSNARPLRIACPVCGRTKLIA